jgi:hypothetical protein
MQRSVARPRALYAYGRLRVDRGDKQSSAAIWAFLYSEFFQRKKIFFLLICICLVLAALRKVGGPYLATVTYTCLSPPFL